nr:MULTISPECIES: hypothetical protein [Leptospira]
MIYGFSNGFYRWNTLVGVSTSEVLGQVLKEKKVLNYSIHKAKKCFLNSLLNFRSYRHLVVFSSV